ncbi:MAG TPA: ADP-ribosylglycohydrolase family protein [Polyangiaceae bacterium]|nr:ADP-ribosylglycohydrolase family protein [Polyangiaceae bacterium]
MQRGVPFVLFALSGCSVAPEPPPLPPPTPASTGGGSAGTSMGSAGSPAAGSGGSATTAGTGGAAGQGGEAGAAPDPQGEYAPTGIADPELAYPAYTPKDGDRVLSRARYLDQLQGFWLGECIANWTGLVTEMDKVGSGTLPFYVDADWGGADLPSIWGSYGPSPTIGYVLTTAGTPWGADDDTDLEYLYQHLLDELDTSFLSGEQIKSGWLEHIYSNEDASDGENYLWVSNESAYYLMLDGLVPPETSDPANNPNYSMIDAQLTTEIFGLFAPARPDLALSMAALPIRATASGEAESAARFYVMLYSLASTVDLEAPRGAELERIALEARQHLPAGSIVADMFDFVWSYYLNAADKDDWEACRDAVYQRYQLDGAAGYVYNQPYDSGINFAASVISLLYGQGDLLRTIQIGTLAGWDSDNPTATWGGLLGFLLGKTGVQAAFGQSELSDTYWIHRTRRGFPDRTLDADGEDTFSDMAARGLMIVDRVVLEELGGGVDLAQERYYVPATATAL